MALVTVRTLARVLVFMVSTPKSRNQAMQLMAVSFAVIV
jgi:hypothetical protein